MDRLTNKKRGTVNPESCNEDECPHTETESHTKRSRLEAPNSVKHTYDDVSTPPVFVPNSYREATLRKLRSDDECSGPLGTAPLTPGSIPNDCEAALLYLKNWFPKLCFADRLPPILLSSQLHSILQETSISSIDFQLKSLVYQNKIIAFPTFSSSISRSSKSLPRISTAHNFLVVFFEDFVALPKHQKDPLFQNFVTNVLPYRNTEDLNVNEKYSSKPSMNEIIKQMNLLRLIPKQKLIKLLHIQDENDLRRLVNAGYLGIHDKGNYCLTLAGAGEFINILEKGRKAVLSSIRKAKFGEILQQELERRPLAKTAPLGVPYHIADLMGSGVIEKLSTTSGPLLRVKRQ